VKFLLDQLEEIARRYLRWRYLQTVTCSGDQGEHPCKGLPVYSVDDFDGVDTTEYFYCDACVAHDGVLLPHHYRMLKRFR
jgi:hypothetical protein